MTLFLRSPSFWHTDLSFVLLELSRTVYRRLECIYISFSIVQTFLCPPARNQCAQHGPLLWISNCLVYLYLNFLIKTVFHHKRKQFDNHIYRSIPRTYSIPFHSIWDLHNGQQFVELAVLIKSVYLFIHTTHFTLHMHKTYSDFETTMLIMPKQDRNENVDSDCVMFRTRKIEPLNICFLFPPCSIAIVSASM